MLTCGGAAEEINTYQTAKINTFITAGYLLHHATTARYIWSEAEIPRLIL